MKYVGCRNTIALGLSLIISISSSAALGATPAPQVLFGPKTYRAQLLKPSYQVNTFNVSNPGLSPGRIYIVNGVGALPPSSACPKPTLRNLLQVLACQANNLLLQAKMLLTRADTLEVVFNGQKVVAPQMFNIKTAQLAVSVPLKAKNEIKVLLKGLPTAYVTVTVDRTSTANQAPLANFTITPGPASDPMNFAFNGSASSDPDGTITSYQWDFGDGGTASGVQAQHRYLELGSYNVTLTVTDNKGAQNSSVKPVVVADTRAPVLTVTTPAQGAVLSTGSIIINGSSDEPLAAVRVNNQDLTLSPDGLSFSGTYVVALTGPITFQVSGTDLAGNTSSVTRSVTIVANQAPQASFTQTAPQGPAPAMILFDGSASSDPDGQPLTYRWQFSDGGTASGALATHEFMSPGTYSVTLTVQDSQGFSAQAESSIAVSAPPVVPDPKVNPPSLITTQNPLPFDLYKFIASGPNPIQTGVTPGYLSDYRMARIRGRLVNEAAQSIAGVKVSAVGFPQLGQTLSRADGEFDFIVNGGGVIHLRFERSGYFLAERKLTVEDLQDRHLGDIYLLRPDAKSTLILANSAQPQVVQGSSMQDQSGPRTGTMIIPASTQAFVVLPNGTKRAFPSLRLRITEATVGPDGPKKMPAPLPRSTAYTYAMDISADEAAALGARHIEFSKPIPYYVDNFIGMPVGAAVPVGTYDEDKGAWLPQADGVVLKIVAKSGNIAQVSVSPSGEPASSQDLAALGMDNAELAQLDSLYPVGKELWRVSLNRFSWTDLNWSMTGRMVQENQGPRARQLQACSDCARAKVEVSGSTLDVSKRTVGEHIDLTGVPFSLNYKSSRVPGYKSSNVLNIPVTPPSGLPGILFARVEVEVAGQKFREDYPASIGFSEFTKVFEWDGKDSLGRPLDSALAQVSVIYGLPMDYTGQTWAAGDSTFGRVSASTTVFSVPGREAADVFRTFPTPLGRERRSGYLSQAIAGWTLDIHHSYDPVTRTLLYGSGEVAYADSLQPNVVTYAGNGQQGFAGDGGPASAARFNNPGSIARGPDGSIYVSDLGNFRIRKISTAGVVTTVVGNGLSGDTGDGGPALSARIRSAGRVAFDAVGNMYFADTLSHRVRKVTPSGTISTIAGLGTPGFSGDAGAATAALLDSPRDLAISAEGSIFIADFGNNRVRKISPDGIINTIAGNGETGMPLDEGVNALIVPIEGPSGIAVGETGNVYVSSASRSMLYRITPGGFFFLEFMPLGNPNGLDINPAGEVLIADTGNARIQKLDALNFPYTVVGATQNPEDSYYASQSAVTARLAEPTGVVWLANQEFLIADKGSHVIRRLNKGLSTPAGGGYTIPSASGHELYQFNANGTHLRTLFANTGSVKWTFEYDANNRLIKITDEVGLSTTIQRDAAGNPQTITGPYGQVTNLAINAEGYLASVSNPAGDTHSLTYGDRGLLATFRRPTGGESQFTYNSLGEIEQDKNALGGVQNLARTDNYSGYEVKRTTGLGRAHTVIMESIALGFDLAFDEKAVSTNVTDENGSNTQVFEFPYAGMNYTFLLGGGLRYDTIDQADPRLGSLTKYERSRKEQRSFWGSYSRNITRKREYTPLSDDSFNFRMQEKTDVNGRLWTSTYASADRSLTTVSPLGRQSKVVTDALERPVLSEVNGIAPVNFTYDAQGRLHIVSQGIRSTEFSYDTRGNIASVRDAAGRTTQFQYDNANRVTREISPDGRETLMTYDRNGNMASLMPPGRPLHEFAYNLLNQMVSYLSPQLPGATSPATFTFDEEMRIRKQVRPDGTVIEYGYNSLGQLAEVSSGGNLLFQYFYTNGQLSSAVANVSEASDSFSYSGELKQMMLTVAPHNAQVRFTHNADTHLESVQVNERPAVIYSYDDDQLLTGTNHLTMNRDATTGFLRSTAMGQITTAMSYNGFGEPSSYEAKVGSQTVFSEMYSRDNLGRITSKVQVHNGQSRTIAYEYDLAGRLTRVRNNGVLVSEYGYDANGNRVTSNVDGVPKAAVYDAQDRLVSYGSSTYAYNANGELASITSPSGIRRFSYDSLGLLHSVQLEDGTLIEYRYDGLARRTTKLKNGVVQRRYVYQSQLQLVAELDGDNNVVAEYVYGTRGHSPDYMIRNGELFRFIHDQLGSVVSVINSETGAVAQSIAYDEWGKIRSDSNPGFQAVGFAGCLYDADVGVCRFGARDYDPAVGRWTSKDPIMFNGGDGNLYGYVLNDPVNGIDPKGTGPVLSFLCHMVRPYLGRAATSHVFELFEIQINNLQETKNNRKCGGRNERIDQEITDLRASQFFYTNVTSLLSNAFLATACTALVFAPTP